MLTSQLSFISISLLGFCIGQWYFFWSINIMHHGTRTFHVFFSNCLTCLFICHLCRFYFVRFLSIVSIWCSIILQVLNGKLLKAKDRNTKREIRKELRALSKEERTRQQLAVADVIKNADVVLTTLTGAFSRKLDGVTFDLVVIDEAAQALEVACWIALLKVRLINLFLAKYTCTSLYV